MATDTSPGEPPGVAGSSGVAGHAVPAVPATAPGVGGELRSVCERPAPSCVRGQGPMTSLWTQTCELHVSFTCHKIFFCFSHKTGRGWGSRWGGAGWHWWARAGPTHTFPRPLLLLTFPSITVSCTWTSTSQSSGPQPLWHRGLVLLGASKAWRSEAELRRCCWRWGWMWMQMERPSRPAVRLGS